MTPAAVVEAETQHTTVLEIIIIIIITIMLVYYSLDFTINRLFMKFLKRIIETLLSIVSIALFRNAQQAMG